MRMDLESSRTRKLNLFVTLSLAFALLTVPAASGLAQEEPPEPPPVSQFAPVEPLLNQVEYHLERVGSSLETSNYSLAYQSRVAKDASVLVILFMALGMHDEESPLKDAAPKLVELAGKIVDSSANQAEAKAAFDSLQAAMKEGASGGKPLSWEVRYQLGLIMKNVTTINARLKRNTRRESSLAARKEEAAGQAAALAVVGQAALVDTHEVKDEADLDDWYGYAAEMRDAAGAVGQAIAQDDFEAVSASMERLQTNCDNCHDKFRIVTP